MYQYPYGNAQQLNLDWILNKIQEIENEGVSPADIKVIVNAVLSASYDSSSAYDVNDIVFNDSHDKLYRCNTAIPIGGEAWDATHWDEILLAPVITNLVEAVSTMNSDDVFNESTVAGIHVTDALDVLSSAITAAVSKDNISETIFKNTASAVDDLDDAPFGSCGYNLSTAHRPLYYGTAYTFQTSTFIYQLAFETNGQIFIRENINNGGWTNWKEFASEQIDKDVAYVVDHKQSATSIPQGKFVILRNSTITGKTDGLYIAANAIAANTDVSGSDLTDVSGGGLNYVNDMVSTLGTTIIWANGTSGNLTTSNDTEADCGTITLPAGIWLLIACGDWEANATGYRQISFSSGKNPARQYTSTTLACEAGKETFHQIIAIRELPSSDTLHLYARQTSGGNLKIYPYMYAVKVGIK